MLSAYHTHTAHVLVTFRFDQPDQGATAFMTEFFTSLSEFFTSFLLTTQN